MSFSQVWFAQVEVIPGPAEFFKPIDLFPGREIKGFFYHLSGGMLLGQFETGEGEIAFGSSFLGYFTWLCVLHTCRGRGNRVANEMFHFFFGRSTISFLSVKRV